MRSPARRASLRSLLAASALACGADSGAAEAPRDARADGPSAPAEVGYDLRRLRPRNEEALQDMFERTRARALADGKRVAVLFSADWCAPCRELEVELGNTHPAALIGDVRILELKEEDWSAVTRMDEFNELRARWYPKQGSYPVLVLLDARGQKLEEMKEAIERLTAAGVEPTLPNWLADARAQRG